MKVSILGARESGVGAALLAKKLDYQVLVSDHGQIPEDFKIELNKHDVLFEESGHTIDRLVDSDVIIKSPGVPEHVPVVQALRKAGLEIISELEFAARHCHGKILAITGSNGKTTTTSLLYHLMLAHDYDVCCAGNIGTSFARALADRDHDYWVLEVSSFQLDDVRGFRPNVAAILNITEDHMDRYHYDLALYAEAKYKIAGSMQADDHLYLNASDPVSREYQKYLPEGFSPKWLDASSALGDTLEMVSGGRLDLSKMKLLGEHNRSNALFALMMLDTVGLDEEKAQSALESFQAPEHRLELFAEHGGVRFINDSKATNVDSVYWALKAMPQDTILILGGKDKGNDYTPIASLIKEKVKHLVCLGVDNEKIKKDFGNHFAIIPEFQDPDLMSQYILAKAETGDTVLLSPACASFDLFDNYQDRGRKFKQAINKAIDKQ